MKPIHIAGLALAWALLCLPQNTAAQWSDWIAPKSADAMKNPLRADETATATGQQLFSAICFVCHGNQGKGDGINAPSLAKKPADLTSRRVQRQSDGALFWKISEGNPPMLSFKESLSEEQRWALVNYVRKLAASASLAAAEVVSKNEKPAKPANASPAAAGKEKPAKEGTAKEQATAPAATAAAANPFGATTDGKTLFRNICKTCHTIGQGKMTGPDLKGVNGRHDRDWLFKWIRSSQSLVKAGDAEAVRLFEENNRIVMTDHQYLTDGQIESILGYIGEEGKNGGTKQRAVAVPSQVVARKTQPPSAYSEMATYFLYAGFAFVIVVLLMVVSILNKMARD